MPNSSFFCYFCSPSQKIQMAISWKLPPKMTLKKGPEGPQDGGQGPEGPKTSSITYLISSFKPLRVAQDVSKISPSQFSVTERSSRKNSFLPTFIYVAGPVHIYDN